MPRALVGCNVWVSGIAFPNGAPGRVLAAIRRGEIDAVASWELAGEITELLRRPRIRALGITERDLQDVLVLLAPILPDVDVGVELRDPDDAPVVSAALSGATEAIVTGDRDLLDEPELHDWLRARGVEVLSPGAVLAKLAD